jgi:hypothetical protein
MMARDLQTGRDYDCLVHSLSRSVRVRAGGAGAHKYIVYAGSRTVA